MSGIILNTAFTNNDLPSAQSYKEQIFQIPSLKNWFQGDARYASIIGSAIQSLNDIAPANDKLNAIKADKPLLVPSLLAGYSAVQFGVNSAFNTLQYSSALDAELPFTIYFCVRCTSIAATNQTIFAKFTSATNRMIAQFKADNTLTLSNGVQSVNVPYVVDEWLWASISYDGAGTIKGRSSTDLVGSSQATTVSANSAPLVLGNLTNGADSQSLIHGEISDVLILTDDISGTTYADTLENYFLKVYGI